MTGCLRLCFMLLGLHFISACTSAGPAPRAIDLKEAQGMLNNGFAAVLELRPPASRARGSLSGAIIPTGPWETLQFKRSDQLIVIADEESKAREGCEYFRRKGFKTAFLVMP